MKRPIKSAGLIAYNPRGTHCQYDVLLTCGHALRVRVGRRERLADAYACLTCEPIREQMALPLGDKAGSARKLGLSSLYGRAANGKA